MRFEGHRREHHVDSRHSAAALQPNSCADDSIAEEITEATVVDWEFAQNELLRKNPKLAPQVYKAHMHTYTCMYPSKAH